MSSERLRLEMFLEEKKQEATKLRMKLEMLRDSIRGGLPRHEPVEIVHGEKIAKEALELAATLEVYRELLDRIAAIKLDLGV